MFRNEPHCPRPAVILLVDDDPGDCELTRRALEKDVLRVDLHTVGDGEEALAYLRGQGKYAGVRAAPRPDLILLDLNMPRLGGQGVLQEMRQHPELNRIPVVVLTTSNQKEDILRSYALGCNSFINKPLDIGQFVEAVRALRHYWFELVALPTGSSAGAH